MRRGPAIVLTLLLSVVVVGFWLGRSGPVDVFAPEEPPSPALRSSIPPDPAAGDPPPALPARAGGPESPSDPALVVRGRITDSEGRPVRGASVRVDSGKYFYPVGGDSADGQWAPADAEGWYVAPLPEAAGRERTFEVLVKAPGFAPGVSGRREIPSGARALDADVVLAPGVTLEARVVESGTNVPVPGATIYVMRESRERNFVQLDGAYPSHGFGTFGFPRDLPPAAVTDAHGRISLPDFAPGACWLVVCAPGFDHGRSGRIEIPGNEPLVVPIHRMPTGEIRGVVSFEDGTPISSARVHAPAGDPGRWRGDFTSADGSFSIDGLPPGVHTLLVVPMSGVQFVPIRRERVPTGAGIVRIVVDRGLTLRARLVDPSGDPAAEVELQLDGGMIIKTDREGRFHRGGHLNRAYRMKVDMRRYYGVWKPFEVDVTPGDDEVVIVGPERHVLGGTVADESGRPLPGLGVRARGTSVEQWAKTDETGRFRFRNLHPGEYRLWIKDWKCAPDRADSGSLDVRILATR